MAYTRSLYPAQLLANLDKFLRDPQRAQAAGEIL